MKKGIVIFLCMLLVWAAVFPAYAAAPGVRCSGDFEYRVRDDGTAMITLYTGNKKALTIPEKIGGRIVTALGRDAFPKGLMITSILIPADVQEIAAGAFRFLAKLAAIGVVSGNPVYVTAQGVLFDKKQKALHTYPRGRNGEIYGIPRGIESVAEGAFSFCLTLKSIFMPESIQVVGAEAFTGCKELFRLALPSKIKSIGIKAFAGCTGLSYIQIPKYVSYIGPGAFSRCWGLEDILVDEENEVYLSFNGALVEKETKVLHTFLSSKAGSVVRIPGGIKAIGMMAFSDCFQMTEVTLPNSVLAIGEEAFAYCYNLTSAFLPESVDAIGDGAFLDCIRLTLRVGEQSFAHQYALDQAIPFTLAEQ